MQKFPLFLFNLVVISSEMVLGQSPSINLEIGIPNNADCYEVGDEETFEVITRWASGGSEDLAFGNINYVLNLGGATVITFSGVNADGSFTTPPSSTNGSVTVSMLDSADADNDFISSTSASDPGLLISEDTLDRPEAGNPSWEADWVFEVVWTVAGGTAPGLYDVSGSETGEIFSRDPDTGVVSVFPFPAINYPGDGETAPQFQICPIPEPSSSVLILLGGSAFAFLRGRQAR